LVEHGLFDDVVGPHQQTTADRQGSHSLLPLEWSDMGNNEPSTYRASGLFYSEPDPPHGHLGLGWLTGV